METQGNFQLLGEVVADDRARIAFGKAGVRRDDRYAVAVNDDGEILLTPLTSIPRRELLVLPHEQLTPRDAREGGQQDLPVVVNGNRVAVVPPYACLTERDTGTIVGDHFTQKLEVSLRLHDLSSRPKLLRYPRSSCYITPDPLGVTPTSHKMIPQLPSDPNIVVRLAAVLRRPSYQRTLERSA